MPLLREAAWIVCLADFSELPPDLRTLVLKHIGNLLVQRQQERAAEARTWRVWHALNLDGSEMLTHIIE